MPYTKTCEICGKEFEDRSPIHSRRTCYDIECNRARAAELRRRSVAKRAALRREGKWKEHQRLVKGIGTGRFRELSSGKFRKCLKCDKEFEVPEGADYRICLGCRAANKSLCNECCEEALGICESYVLDTIALCALAA